MKARETDKLINYKWQKFPDEEGAKWGHKPDNRAMQCCRESKRRCLLGDADRGQVEATEWHLVVVEGGGAPMCDHTVTDVHVFGRYWALAY